MSLEVINHSTTVNEQLKKMTEDFLSRHSNITLNALAQRSGVAATTLRRLMQDESKSDIAPHTVLSLVSYILREKKISRLIKMIDGPVGEMLRRCFDQFIFDEEESKHQIDSDLNEVFKDKINYLIYKMAANQFGVKLSEIKDSFGLLGLNKVSELIAKGWIIIDEKETLHAKEKNFSIDLVRAQELVHVLVDQYKPCDVEKGYNLFYSLSEGLNEEGVMAIKSIEIEAVKKVFEVMNNNKYMGSIPYFSIFLSDVMGLTPNELIKREVIQ